LVRGQKNRRNLVKEEGRQDSARKGEGERDPYVFAAQASVNRKNQRVLKEENKSQISRQFSPNVVRGKGRGRGAGGEKIPTSEGVRGRNLRATEKQVHTYRKITYSEERVKIGRSGKILDQDDGRRQWEEINEGHLGLMPEGKKGRRKKKG